MGNEDNEVQLVPIRYSNQWILRLSLHYITPVLYNIAIHITTHGRRYDVKIAFNHHMSITMALEINRILDQPNALVFFTSNFPEIACKVRELVVSAMCALP